MVTWKLRTGADRRIRSGHPWVFSNELESSPKGLPPGEPVTLLDSKGAFVASGYGNPHSLIAFRAMSFDSQNPDPMSVESLVDKVISAWGHRQLLGYQRSFRLIYGEGDFFPGLVLDRYLLESGEQVLAFQILTAGTNKALANLEYFGRRIVEESVDTGLSTISWDKTVVVRRADVNIRKLEGLTVEKPELVKSLAGVNLSDVWVQLDPIGYRAQPAGSPSEHSVLMSCDLVEGQKTGFFLDQSWNIDLVGQVFSKNLHLQKTVRILDLCCYVGQWSTKLADHLTRMGVEVFVELVDVSKSALAYAEKNVTRAGGKALVRELDVMEGLGLLPDQHYDLVIADPPAFIKAKKDLPTGRHAYLKFNTHAFRLVKPGGIVVSCSCSGLFPIEELMFAVGKSIARNHLEARCVATGGHAPDHPTLMSFPEGNYLKMLAHQVSAK